MLVKGHCHLLILSDLKSTLCSGAVHFMASNNDSGVRDFDMERFQQTKHFCFDWPVNVSIPSVNVNISA